ncbi:hypothetical protein CEP52_009973 [Fusarium oligoseptatum]|uniref:SUI1 domain-containing protein n=1 Tax=Fusarium oligoseptatum TaxID=2604345 RepID=A0A428TAL3_9HYPO|nr:hypothetical protein CEP52_009973 [Fusarium oligoseptatum]
MFKKKPEIKNLAPLRSSDRRKLADQIIRDYRIPIPQLSPDDDTTSSGAQQTLSSLRNSLLPESTSSARFTTSSGPNLAQISGTIYVGACPGQDERILWFQFGKIPKLIPTVYTLWHNPNIVPLLHTPDFVVEEKLTHGSDLMIPGLIKAPSAEWDSRAITGSVVAVAGMQKDTVPLWIGTCQVDICKLPPSVRGQKGVAVKALHWAGDECWSWRPLGSGGQAPPESLDGWPGLTAGAAEGIQQMSLEDNEDDGHEADNGAPVENSAHEEGSPKDDKDAAEEEEYEPTTKDIDDAFQKAFLYAIHKAKADKQGPNFGFVFPIQPSFLISNMIQPYLRSQNPQYYIIKKTSWKNAKKFIKHLDKLGLVKSKDRNGGETVILDIDFDDDLVTGFRPYNLPKPKAAGPEQTKTGESSGQASSSADVSLGQSITIQNVYRLSPKLVPTLLPSKTEFYTAQQVSAALKSYIEQRPELGGQGSSTVKLDTFLANNILGTNPSHDDSQAFASGRISRSALQKRVLDDSHLCQPFYVIKRKDSASDQKPKAGHPPHVLVTIEKRTGTKVVTKISNLEPFFIDPQLLAPELQKKCAGSASVGQASGAKPGLLEIVVQGDQRKIVVGEVLPKRGIDAKWVDVVDKTKAKKKK